MAQSPTGRGHGFFRVTELYLWILAAAVVAGPIFLDIGRGAPLSVIIYERYTTFLLALLIGVFPFIFFLIFSALPIESLRRKLARRGLEVRPERCKAADDISEAESGVISKEANNIDLSAAPATKLFASYAASSSRLSQKLYGRAGVYLLVGVLVAFSGLAFFYSQTLAPFYNPALQGADNESRAPGEVIVSWAEFGMSVAQLAPKFGILFFIEFVAFFFLRQYRAAMDEFRYYEAIKRCREEILALIRLAADSGMPLEPVELVKTGCFFSKAGVLKKGEASEIVESRKLEKDEIALLEKVIDAINRSSK